MSNRRPIVAPVCHDDDEQPMVNGHEIEEVKPIEIDKKKKPKTKAHYDSESMSYLTQNDRGEWIRSTETHVKRILREEVFADIEKKEKEDYIDRYLINLQRQQDVSLAIPLAGFPIGVHTINHNRVLVTRQAAYVRPRQGKCDNITSLIEQLLGDQSKYAYAWMKAAFRTLRAGHPFRPGQLLAIAGPAGCGKGLLQSLITEMFGGRSADPYEFMIGDTNFSSELFYAEHLMIEDNEVATDIRSRRNFGAKIKKFLVNHQQKYHRKAKEAATISPFWRMTLTVNDEPENLMVLPPLDDSLKDKIILLKSMPTKLPFVMDDFEGRRKSREGLSAELPAFMHWLRGYRLPDQYADLRYGVKAFQNVDLVEEVAALSPEERLLSLCDAVGLFSEFGTEWQGTAAELERVLREKDKTGEVGRLLHFSSACGVYLSRLQKRHPERVDSVRTEGNRKKWILMNS